MNQLEIIEVLEKRGAILRGHFRLSSGRHSDVFVQKFRVFEHPKLTQRFGESIAQLFPGAFEVVASPAVGAIALGFATGLAADVRVVFSERVEGVMEFRRGFELKPRERTLIVEDVLTTGGSAREVLSLVKDAGGYPIGIGALLDRGDPARFADLGVPVKALVHMDATSWDPAGCPLCERGEPVTDPGSRRAS